MNEIITIGQPKTTKGKPEVKIGDKWNFLTIIAEAPRAGLGRVVLCRCTCGKIKSYLASYIRYGSITSCGLCSRKQRKTLSYRRSSKYDSETAARSSLYTVYKSKAKQSKRQFSLTFEKFCSLTKRCCAYCGKPPSNEHYRNRKTAHISHQVTCLYNGIDRIDNAVGYTDENVTTCCETCNRAKLKMALPEFKRWIKSVYTQLILNRSLGLSVFPI